MSEPIHTMNIPIVGTTSGVSGSMASDINSVITNLDSIVSYSIRAEFTGTPLGILQLQVSDDVPTTGNPTGWTIVTDSIQQINSDGSYAINVEIPAFSWVRLQYVRTSGTGTLTARLNAKRR